MEYNYKKRPVILEDINLYKFCANYWPRKNGTVQTSKPVQFYGFHDKPTWPVTESYSRWNLTIFKPWQESVNNLKFLYATFAEVFLNF